MKFYLAIQSVKGTQIINSSCICVSILNIQRWKFSFSGNLLMIYIIMTHTISNVVEGNNILSYIYIYYLELPLYNGGAYHQGRSSGASILYKTIMYNKFIAYTCSL